MMFRVRDDLARNIELAGIPRRIVSLVPSVTELVCELGCAEKLVAVTRYCTVPRDVVVRLERVGGPKDPACSRIMTIEPDVALLSTEENRVEDFEVLVGAGVPVFAVAVSSVEGAARSVRNLGALLDERETAAVLADEIDAVRAEVVNRCERRRRVFCPVWRDPWVSFNRKTFAHDLLDCAGGENVCGSADKSYPEVELSDIERCQPEVILLPDEPYPFSESDIAGIRPLVDTPAWKDGQVYKVDGRDLFWYGPRTPAALRRLSRLLARRD